MCGIFGLCRPFVILSLDYVKNLTVGGQVGSQFATGASPESGIVVTFTCACNLILTLDRHELIDKSICPVVVLGFFRRIKRQKLYSGMTDLQVAEVGFV